MELLIRVRDIPKADFLAGVLQCGPMQASNSFMVLDGQGLLLLPAAPLHAALVTPLGTEGTSVLPTGQGDMLPYT